MQLDVKRKIVVYGVGVAVICLVAWGAIALLRDDEPLKKYGVTYETRYGEHVEYQTVQFYWSRGKAKIDGPVVTGEDLYATFPRVDRDPVPEILVRSETAPQGFVLLKLNFNDPKKPEFECVAFRGLTPRYPPPWNYFYDDKKQETESFQMPR